MTYQQAIDYLLGQLPFYQRIGPAAYKANLDNTISLSNYFGQPEKNIRHIHVAGTNGKGSVCHMIASVLQEHGFKTGLATSPHLKDYRERIRVNGKKIPREYVKRFVSEHIDFFKTLQASFFEISIALTFKYFSDEKVDIAVIETGLGGRLDSTNIIQPMLSVITNIGLDHTSLLGNTLEKIAKEKAGIIKANTPVVIGRDQEAIRHVFEGVAAEKNAEMIVAPSKYAVLNSNNSGPGSKAGKRLFILENTRGEKKSYVTDLLGDYQAENLVTTITALDVLAEKAFIKLDERSLLKGLSAVTMNTGLTGRWQILRQNPRVICDTAHNADGVAAVVTQLSVQSYCHLRMVFGMVKDKDIDLILALLPKEAQYYFCEPQVPRKLAVKELEGYAHHHGLKGCAYLTVQEALVAAMREAGNNDLIFVGGSTFVVAEVI